MPDAVTHPTRSVLSAFSLGKLADAEAALVAGHLEACADCRRLLEQLPPDSFVGKVRAARPRSGTQLPGASGLQVPDPVGDSQPAPPPNLPPELANHPKYRIVRELGRGGMGVVYEAIHTGMDRRIAIKVINPSVLEHPDALPRFQSEVKAAGKLEHENIVRAYDTESVGSLHLLVMEFVKGKNLADYVRQQGPLSIVQACHCVRQAALGLQHAFEQGMVHRDIKPHNLMVTANGKLKILDFGLARVRGGRAKGPGLTQADAFMGTPEYVSPEQATDARNADIRSDIYSLGCTLYFLLTGRPPFQEETLVKLVLAQIEKEPQPLHELRQDAPEALSAVVARMLAKDPTQRYQKPVEVAQALMPFLKAGAKRDSGAIPVPHGVSSPKTATVSGGDTSRLPGVKQVAPAPVSPENDAAPFDGLGGPTTPKPTKREVPQPPQNAIWQRPVVLRTAAVVLLAVVLTGLLAAVVFRVTTSHGTIFLEDLPPDAVVTVDGGTVAVKPGDGNTYEISVTPGQKHRLQVKKDGFKVFGEEVQIEAGGRKPVKVTLEPLAAVARRPEQLDQARPPIGVPATDRGWVSLFNGNNLIGWKTHPSQPGDWRVANGALVGSEAKPSYLYTTRDDYRDFHLRVEARVNDAGNSGVGFRTCFGVPADRATFPIGYEAEINCAQEGANRTGSLFADGTAVVSNFPSPVPPNDWFTMEVIAEGSHIIVKVNGKTTADFNDEKRSYRSGHIALQQQDWKTVAEFRKIEIKELPTTNAKAAPTTEPPTGEQGFAPLFDGKDLTGWTVFPQGTGNWKVEDGAIMCSGDTSHLFSERGDYANFHLRVEAKINDKGNSGQYFRTLFGPGRLKGYEAQIATRGDPAVKTGSLYPAFRNLSPEERQQIVLPDAPHQPEEWFTQEVIADGDRIIIKVNGKTTVDFVDRSSTYQAGHFALQHNNPNTKVWFRKIEVKELPPSKPAAAQVPVAPAAETGFVPLFNGKDLTGWQGVVPLPERAKLTRAQLATRQRLANEKILPHWTVRDGNLHYDGKGDSLQTATDYGNFELWIDWKIEPKGDSGIYLRGNPQVQIWDTTEPAYLKHDADKGSGGLWNNPKGSPGRDPLVHADKPVGEWNTFRIIMQGDKVTVHLNGKLVVDKAPLSNYWAKGTQRLPAKGPIELQHHNSELWFRNIYIKALE